MNKSTKEHLYAEAITELDAQLLPNYNTVANKYGLNRSTLSRWHQGKQRSRASANLICRQYLTTAEEASLVGYINKLTDRGIPPTASIVRNLAEEMIGRSVGKNWTGQFVKCYKNRLKSLYLYNIDKDRVKAEYPPIFDHYYKLVSLFCF
jgi:transcriptional regulator with XRE-family HTH domain